MPYRPKKTKKPEAKTGDLESSRIHGDRLAEQRRQNLAARSTLSRLRNRKSDLK